MQSRLNTLFAETEKSFPPAGNDQVEQEGE